jgi:hypothetical protein
MEFNNKLKLILNYKVQRPCQISLKKSTCKINEIELVFKSIFNGFSWSKELEPIDLPLQFKYLQNIRIYLILLEAFTKLMIQGWYCFRSYEF